MSGKKPQSFWGNNKNHKRKKKKTFGKQLLLAVVMVVVVIIALWGESQGLWSLDFLHGDEDGQQSAGEQQLSFSLDDIPEWNNKASVIINDNIPSFTEEQKACTTSFESYGELDSLGRCTTAFACIGKDVMPTGERDFSLTGVTPTGWINKRYDSSIVSGGWIYNRCHLIGWQLTAEEDNELNLITGTRYLNVEGDPDTTDDVVEGGMLVYENLVADYLKEYPARHVLYRVTPIFEGNNLLASGVQMEAWSVEDNGEGICFNVYCYNVQPGITLDYATGESELAQ